MEQRSAKELSGHREKVGVGSVLLLTGCAALAAGLGEAGLRFALLPFRELLGNRVYLDPQSIWMAPLINLVVLLPLTLVAFGIGKRVKGGQYAYPAAVLVAVFLAAFTVSMITRRVSEWALAALSLGVAWQVARLANARPALATRLVRGLAAALFLACLVGTAFFNGRRAWREHSLRSSLADAAPGSPNVLLLVLDTVRGMEMGAYGYPHETTPNIDRWAARGIVFDRAFATAPWTLPSHASLFTGKWPHELGVGWARPMPDTHLTLSERLDSLGYATGGFAANVIYASWLFGLQDGFSRYRDYQLSPSGLLGASTLGRRVIAWWNGWRGDYVMAGRVSARDVNQAFLDWERGVENGRPWFAFLNYFDAHDPYDPDEPYRTKFRGTVQHWRALADLRQRPPEELRALQAAYDGALSSLDADVGFLLDDLERRGVLRNTIVIITSDHGEEFGEHGHTGHGGSQYTPVLHVPLIVLLPGETEGVRIRRFVSLRDVAATIEGLVSHGRRVLPGTSLRPLWTGDTLAAVSPVFSDVQRMATLPARYPISKTDIQSLITDDRWHLIRPEGGAAELYDLSVDFMEQKNLAGDPLQAARVKGMTDSLVRLRGR